jgi:hypothetical protein
MAVPPLEPPPASGDRVPLSDAAKAFARIEGLIGEEHALLMIPAHERSEAQHRRLREIAAELDGIWERLRERAERLGVSPRHGTGAQAREPR